MGGFAPDLNCWVSRKENTVWTPKITEYDLYSETKIYILILVDFGPVFGQSLPRDNYQRLRLENARKQTKITREADSFRDHVPFDPQKSKSAHTSYPDHALRTIYPGVGWLPGALLHKSPLAESTHVSPLGRGEPQLAPCAPAVAVAGVAETITDWALCRKLKFRFLFWSVFGRFPAKGGRKTIATGSGSTKGA